MANTIRVLAALFITFGISLGIYGLATAGPVLPHEHTCHIERVYTDYSVAYPPTVFEAHCDGAVIRLYED